MTEVREHNAFGEPTRVRRVRPDGIIESVAGSTTSGFSGDNGFALSARMSFPDAIAFFPDGTLRPFPRSRTWNGRTSCR